MPGGSLPAAMSLLGELIAKSRVGDLNRCRSLFGIPTTTTRKKDLADALLLHARCPQNHRAVMRRLTENMIANDLRSWISGLRQAGFVVPPSKVMGRCRADIIDAIVRLDCGGAELAANAGKLPGWAKGQVGEYSPTAEAPESHGTDSPAGLKRAGEYSPALEAPNSHGADSSGLERAGEYSPAHEAPNSHGADFSAGLPAGNHDAGMVLVAYDAGGSPEAKRRKMCRKWMKLARKADVRSRLPGRVRHAVAEALQQYPDTMVCKLREAVENKLGVDLSGKYAVLFDKVLLRLTAKPEKKRKPRRRFVLAVRRRRDMRAPAS